MLPAVLTGVCVAGVAGLLAAERAGSRTGRYVSKPLASAAFVALALALGAGAHVGHDYPTWILIGLVLGAGGDVALMFDGKPAFLAGLGLFLAGHVAYVIACATVVPPADWLAWPALVPLAAAAIALRWLWPHIGAMRGPVIAYVVTITLMVIGATAVLRAAQAAGATGRAPWLLAAGALLFFASDLAVARDKFVAAGFVNRAWGLPAYYAGQLLFCWSLAA